MPRLTTKILTIILLMLVGMIFATPQVRGQGSVSVSTIYISPVRTCCNSTGGPLITGHTITVDVNISLTQGQSMNAFDVRINYTNPFEDTLSKQVLQAVSIGNSTNLFAPYGPGPVDKCIDGQPVPANSQSCPSDVIGQVHFGEVLFGKKLTGPLNGELFDVTFNVKGNGTSVFTVDTAQVVNPTPDPSDPSLVGPVEIPLVTQGGVFGNKGAVAYFNYKPADLTVSPSVLPNHIVDFDASASFAANNASTGSGIKSYLWNFGDGTGNITGTSPLRTHTFALPGNYSVLLVVADYKNETGAMTRRVSVSPALGNLQVTVEDNSGNLQRGNVRILLYNSSSSSVPIFNQTTNGAGVANLVGLSPANYYLSYQGLGVISGSKTEAVIPGFTQQDTIFVSFVTPPPDYAGIIYLGALLAAVGTVAAVIIIRNMKSRRANAKKGIRPSKAAYRKS